MPTEPNHAAAGLMASMSSSVPDPCSGETHYRFYTGCWGNGANIRLQPVSSEFEAQLAAAVDDWNEYLTQDNAAPRFVVAGAGAPFDVRVNAIGSGSSFCGKFALATLDTVSIVASTNPLCGGAHTGPWGAAMRQELAGILGWNEAVEGASISHFEPGLTTQCVLHLIRFVDDPEKVINENVCLHEAEGAVLAYRSLENTVAFDRMFRDTVYMHVTVKGAPTSLPVGQTAQLVADTFFSGNPGGGQPALIAGSGHIYVAKPTSGAVEWRSTTPTFAIHLGGGLFRGEAQGTAYGAARPSGEPSTNTRWWLPFKERGDSVALVVPAPPPPPDPPPTLPFQVDSIGTDQMPITVATSHLFTARVISAPPGSLTTIWIITDSRTPTVSDTVTVSGNTLWRSIDEGSYAISLTVRPVVGGVSGFAAIQDIPVCATPDEHLWGGGGKQGGGSTNAIPGCENYQW